MSNHSFKQIIRDELTGKLKIIDNENRSYNCNLYGEKSPEFLPNVSGFSSFGDRKKINVLKEINLDLDRSLYRPQNSNIL